jgi:protein TonB
MTDFPSEDIARPTIVDLVFAGEPDGGRRRVALGGLLVMAINAAGFLVVSHSGRSAGPWTAEMAARIHDTIATERAIDVTPPPPTAAPAPAKESPTLPPARFARAPRNPRTAPRAPAQAAQLAAASSAPADFTGLSFVVGSGATYAGGTTTASGTSRTPVAGPVTQSATGSGATIHNRARSVSLDEGAWSCPWPSEADAEQVNEQTVVLRAAIRPDGRAERVDVLADPGLGFGAAARACALATRFATARDPAGQPIAALSPPIRVHFFR